MRFIIATDIFGLTDELKAQCLYIAKNNELHIVDPYDGKQFYFENGSEAYQKFLDSGGHDRYKQLVDEQIRVNIKETIHFIGFSAGAAAIWRALDGFKNSSNCRFTGFYPNQIRNFLKIELQVPTELIFAQSEKHFDLNKVISKLKHYSLLNITQTQYQHGFMNPRSEGFNATAYQFYMKQLCKISLCGAG